MSFPYWVPHVLLVYLGESFNLAPPRILWGIRLVFALSSCLSSSRGRKYNCEDVEIWWKALVWWYRNPHVLGNVELDPLKCRLGVEAGYKSHLVRYGNNQEVQGCRYGPVEIQIRYLKFVIIPILWSRFMNYNLSTTFAASKTSINHVWIFIQL